MPNNKVIDESAYWHMNSKVVFKYYDILELMEHGTKTADGLIWAVIPFKDSQDRKHFIKISTEEVKLGNNAMVYNLNSLDEKCIVPVCAIFLGVDSLEITDGDMFRVKTMCPSEIQIKVMTAMEIKDDNGNTREDIYTERPERILTPPELDRLADNSKHRAIYVAHGDEATNKIDEYVYATVERDMNYKCYEINLYDVDEISLDVKPLGKRCVPFDMLCSIRFWKAYNRECSGMEYDVHNEPIFPLPVTCQAIPYLHKKANDIIIELFHTPYPNLGLVSAQQFRRYIRDNTDITNVVIVPLGSMGCVEAVAEGNYVMYPQMTLYDDNNDYDLKSALKGLIYSYEDASDPLFNFLYPVIAPAQWILHSI